MSTFTIDAQRLRTLTTHRLHTVMSDVYEDLAIVTGETGIMTHQIPVFLLAIEPWLPQQGLNPRFWNGAHDPTHTGAVSLREPSEQDRAEMLART